MKPAQVRMARGALNWSLQQLAAAAGVHRNTISNFELGKYAGEQAKLIAIQRALEKAGVVFVEENGEGPGVRLKAVGEAKPPARAKPKPKAAKKARKRK